VQPRPSNRLYALKPQQVGLSGMVDSFLLNGIGFGCVGLASVYALVGPLRNGAHPNTEETLEIDKEASTQN